MKATITSDEISRRIAPSGLKMLSGGDGLRGEGIFQCEAGHTFTAVKGAVAQKGRRYNCPVCRAEGEQQQIRERESAEPESSLCIYIMATSRDEICKIGISTSPLMRLRHIRKEKGDPTIRLVWAEPFFFAREVEAVVHELLRSRGYDAKDQLYYGEWFAISPDGAMRAIYEVVDKMRAAFDSFQRKMEGATLDDDAGASGQAPACYNCRKL